MGSMRFKKSIIILFVCVLPACGLPFIGGYGSNGLSKEEFTRYVEAVFRLQNSLTSKAMMLMEEDESNAVYLPVVLAEKQMHLACRYLNEYATRDAEGLNISFALQRQVQNTAESCDLAAKQLAARLSELR